MDSKTHMPPEYYFDSLYRYVKVYHYTYHTNCKARWIKRNIFDVFTSEFKAFDSEYYKKAIEEGRIRVNKQVVDLGYVLKSNDKIEHETIRKEPPVYKYEIPIIHEDPNFLIINKPPSIPIHVCGSYLHNTIINILKHDNKYKELYTLHRLDKLTSGLLMLSKSQDLAFKFHDDLKNNRVQKVYLARVHGNFPGAEGDEMVVEKPIYCTSPKLSKYDVCKFDEIEEKKAKEAKTIIKKLWYDEETDSSLVECRPITGKTHQIRVHCKSLGFPIINDRSYGGKFVGNLIENEILKKGPEQVEESKTDVSEKKIHKLGNVSDNDSDGDLDSKLKKKVKQDKDHVDDDKNVADEKKEEVKKDTKEDETKNKSFEKGQLNEDEEINEDEKTFIMEIWLHSQRYKYRDYEFEAPYPYWAKKEFKFHVLGI